MNHILQYRFPLLLFFVYYVSAPCSAQAKMDDGFYFPRYYHPMLDTVSNTQLLIGLASMKQISNWKIPPSYKHYLGASMLNQKLLETLKRTKLSTKRLFVFGGFWWCPDTRDIVEKLMIALQQSEWNANNVSFVGMDREKKTACHLGNIFSVYRVPTIIVMKEGKEVGRIVEYGKTGDWQAELVALLSK